MSSKFVVAVKNFSTVVADSEAAKAIPSFQKQVSGDFGPVWGLDANLRLLGKKEKVPAGAWVLAIFDNADQAGALGYHDLAKSGQPLGKVFAKTTIDNGGKWTVTFSHELLRDARRSQRQFCRVRRRCSSPLRVRGLRRGGGRRTGYAIDGVTVSDFVLPGWFEPLHVAKGEKFAHKSKVGGPFELLAGGYIGYYDLNGGGWQQLTAREPADVRMLSARSAGPGSYEQRPRVGSRRERRRTPKSQWLLSTEE